jgi:glycosyltransferase involved in cell wall biosynthesis
LQRYLAGIPRSERCLFVLNGIFHPSVYAVSRALRKHALPYVMAPHDPYHPTIFQKNAHFKWIYWYLVERKMLKKACAVQVLDQRHGELLRRLHVDTPVFEVPNGFSPDDIVPESTLEWNHNGVPEFLFLGRIDSYNKGLDILLNALAQLTEIPEWRLTFQGPDWGDRAGLKEQAQRLQLADRVTFLDPDFATSPAALIAKYDIFCVTSRFEGFSLSALEAMLAGRILLISEIAGIAPHVEASGCGVVVEPEPAPIKAGLLELLKRREQWKEMGLRGRKYALDRLHWTPIAAQALKEYERLIR